MKRVENTLLRFRVASVFTASYVRHQVHSFLFKGNDNLSFLLCISVLTEPHHIPSNLITPLSLNDIPPRIAQTMENEDSWDFDIFNLEAATMKRQDNNTKIPVYDTLQNCIC